MLEDVWLGGKESPQPSQYGSPNTGDVFESPSKILKESDLKSKDVQYCDRNDHLSGRKKNAQRQISYYIQLTSKCRKLN